MSLGENSLVAAYQGKGQLKSRPSGTRVVTVCMQPTYLRELFTIQPNRSTRSSSYLTLSRPPGHLPSHVLKKSHPSLHRVSGMTCHLNYAPFLYLHHHHSKS